MEGTKFIGCSFSDCDFGNVNIDYSLFSKNEYDKVVFPFYQIAYIIGAADFLRDDSAQIYAQAGDKKVSSREFFEQADRLKIYYLDKSEYFPACNLSIAQQKFDDAKRYLLIGIEQALVNKNFRMISNFCRLAKYHGMADERIKSKILKSMDDFIQKKQHPRFATEFLPDLYRQYKRYSQRGRGRFDNPALYHKDQPQQRQCGQRSQIEPYGQRTQLRTFEIEKYRRIRSDCIESFPF